MARSKINSASKDLIKDNGAVLISIIQGEQIATEITINWVVNLSGYTITAKVVEADMNGTFDENNLYPIDVRSNGVVTNLAIIDDDTTDNKFKIVIPEDLANQWATQPTPTKPSYGWIGLEIQDTGIGNRQQIWKPFRGLVEVLYSPSEAVVV